MADQSASIFNKKATEKLRSPDDLDKYIRVTNPSVWIILAACIALLVGTLAWALFGSVTTSVSATGVCVNEQVVCFLLADDAAEVSVGDIANVDGENMKVTSISPVPLSRDEAYYVLMSDYLVSSLVKGDWSYLVSFEGDISNIDQNKPVSIRITTENISPISLILGGQQ